MMQMDEVTIPHEKLWLLDHNCLSSRIFHSWSLLQNRISSVMKLPLPADTFPKLELSPEDVAKLEDVAHSFVQERMVQAHEHWVLARGVVDTNEWKKMRTREQVSVYRERTVNKASRDENGQAAVMPMMMAVGTIQGSLDDVMYGVVNHTTNEMRVHTAYVEDYFADMGMLASLIKPSIDDPMRSLSIKWAIKQNPAATPPPIVRLRDLVYLESTGFARTAAGERIGYQLLHSVQLPGIHELHEYNIVRANVSFCYIYQQAGDGVVSVFMRGIMNVFGSVPASITTFSASQALVSTWRNVHCAQMKKLMWIVRSSKPRSDSQRPSSSKCDVCHQSRASKECCACRERVCSRCSVRKTLSFILPSNPNVASPVKLNFCTRCVLRAAQANTMDVAVQDVMDGDAAVRVSSHSLVRQTSSSMSFSSTRS